MRVGSVRGQFCHHFPIDFQIVSQGVHRRRIPVQCASEYRFYFGNSHGSVPDRAARSQRQIMQRGETVQKDFSLGPVRCLAEKVLLILSQEAVSRGADQTRLPSKAVFASTALVRADP